MDLGLNVHCRKHMVVMTGIQELKDQGLGFSVQCRKHMVVMTGIQELKDQGLGSRV